MKAMINSAEDLKGATPETLARALLRPGQGSKPVVGGKVAVKQVTANKSGDSSSHLRKRS